MIRRESFSGAFPLLLSIDLTGYDYIDWEADVYKRPGKYNKVSDFVEFTVTSANQKHTQKYKITVWQKDAKQFKDISKVRYILDLR